MPGPDPDLSDEDLVRRAQAGDAVAARTLYERHERLLRLHAKRRLVGGLRRKVAASDLVQDAYLAAFRDLGRFEDRGPGSFRRWLQQILSSKANDQVKRFVRAGKRDVRREQSQGEGACGPAAPSPHASPSEDAAAAEERLAVLRALGGLGGDARRVVELVALEGLGFPEAGAALGRSAEAARKLYARAVVRLSRRVRAP